MVMISWAAICLAVLSAKTALAFNAPSDVPTWYGKPYMSRYVGTRSCHMTYVDPSEQQFTGSWGTIPVPYSAERIIVISQIPTSILDLLGK